MKTVEYRTRSCLTLILASPRLPGREGSRPRRHYPRKALAAPLLAGRISLLAADGQEQAQQQVAEEHRGQAPECEEGAELHRGEGGHPLLLLVLGARSARPGWLARGRRA